MNGETGAAEMFSRSSAILGAGAAVRLAGSRVLVVGVGGVGSWCAEALVRTGVGRIALMDDDVVAPSNVNRQCQATTATVGRPKVEALGERLRMINPACDVAADRGRFTGGDAGAFDGVDAAVDAIDSVDCKAELLILATAAGVPVVSSMGAALRTDPTRVRVTPFGEVEGDALAKALRRRFRRLGRFPSAEFPCVWSAEPALSREVRGSLMQVTATFGMCLAAAVVNILTKGEGKWKK